MLKQLRNKQLIRILMWSLVVIFIMWGAGSMAVSRKTYAGSIFGKKISLQEYNRNYVAVLNRAKIMYGYQLPKMEKFLNLNLQTWNRLILKYEAKKKHLKASNKEIVENVAMAPLFQRNGTFDKNLYSYIVQNVFSSSMRDFEESVRDDIIIGKLMNAITKDVRITDEEIRKVYIAENETADLSYVIVKADDYKKDAAATDEEAAAYYAANKDKFLMPLSLRTSYIRIPFTADTKEAAEQKIQDILYFLKDNNSLEKASKQFNIELKDTGFFSVNSPVPEIGLCYPFSLTAMNLEKNQTSDIVETDDSFYIIRLNDKRPPAGLSFDEARDKAGEEVITQKAFLLAQNSANELLAYINSSNKTFEDAAKETGYDISRATNITQKGYVEELGPAEAFMEVFSLKPGQVSSPLRTNNGYCIIRLDSLIGIDEDKFKSEKEAFGLKILDLKKEQYFQNWFNDLKNKAGLKNNLTNQI